MRILKKFLILAFFCLSLAETLAFSASARRSAIPAPPQADAAEQAVQALQKMAAYTREDLATKTETPEVESNQKVAHFIITLKGLVDKPEANTICWTPDGKKLSIPKPEKFIQQLSTLTGYEGTVGSFLRQLHFYGFKKAGGSRHQDWVYFHKDFDRAGKNLHKVHRKTIREKLIEDLKSQVSTLETNLTKTQELMIEMSQAMKRLLEEQPAVLADRSFNKVQSQEQAQAEATDNANSLDWTLSPDKQQRELDKAYASLVGSSNSSQYDIWSQDDITDLTNK